EVVEQTDALEDDNEIATAQVLALVFGFGIAANDDLAAQFLGNTFILTFASIADQAPVGETANFDPTNGAGSITVPDLPPGSWAVAASCVFPDASDPVAFQAAIADGTAFLLDE